MGSLGRVLLSLLDFFEDLANVSILAFFDGADFSHDILEEVLDEQLRLFVTVHSLINLNSDHLTQLVSYCHLAALEAIDFVSNRVVNLGHFSPQSDFLLAASHLLLPDPAVDAADLSLQVLTHRLDGLVFALELVADVSIHGVVALAHLFNTLSSLFPLHTFFDVHLIANIFDLTLSFLLLGKQAVD